MSNFCPDKVQRIRPTKQLGIAQGIVFIPVGILREHLLQALPYRREWPL